MSLIDTRPEDFLALMRDRTRVERLKSLLASMAGLLRTRETAVVLVETMMLVGFSAGGLSRALAAHTPGATGFVGLDPFDGTMPADT